MKLVQTMSIQNPRPRPKGTNKSIKVTRQLSAVNILAWIPAWTNCYMKLKCFWALLARFKNNWGFQFYVFSKATSGARYR